MRNKTKNQNKKEKEKKNEKEISDECTKEEDGKVLQFLDSMDSYLTLMDSLSSTLRQGWIELASARYSMGASRVTSALYDLKLHPAVTTLQVRQLDGESPRQDPMVEEPHFTLSRWLYSSEDYCYSRETGSDEADPKNKNSSSLLRHRGTSQYPDDKEFRRKASPVSPRSPLTGDDQVQKERSKSLSVFGKLVSPKLREAQVSFETALETLIKIANVRSLMLSAHAQVQQDLHGTFDLCYNSRKIGKDGSCKHY
ncbi:hypothetical protein IFM89_037448 [Coptis chinensis]|uniref:Vacuolar ATPase assembly protein VMA22 n=1 Tax=Coptis chinensis TaxID=261450 RepID=A0A835LQG9_9MAGN|nr:hypothetical protein IFM89_037448 [Coptis chinensis]